MPSRRARQDDFVSDWGYGILYSDTFDIMQYSMLLQHGQFHASADT